MSAPSSRVATTQKAFGGALVLLVISVGINYIDRGNLSVAAPLIQRDLHLGNERLGALLSAFFWTYATFQFVAGWLVENFDANWVLLFAFCAWSLCTAATGFATGFTSLLVLRLVVGVGESVAYPAYSKIFALHLDEGRRGMANALIDVGCKLGPAIGTMFGGFYMARYGWHSFFFILGLGAMLWVPFWIRGMPKGGHERAHYTGPKPSVGEILRHRSAWGSFLGLFCANYYWYFLLLWLPSYLVHERGFSMQRMAIHGSLPLFVTALSTTGAGIVSYRAIRAGYSVTVVRKICTACGIGLAGIIIVAVPVFSNPVAGLACLYVGSIFYGIYTSSHWTITQTIAGPRAAGRWTGLQNMVGNFAGIVAPWVTGVVVQHTGKFFWAFAITGIIAVIGAFSYIFGIGRIEPAVWKTAPIDAVAASQPAA